MGWKWDEDATITEPVDLNTAKAHLRVDGPEEDALITALISAARQYCEKSTNLILCSQNWTMTLDAFPDRQEYQPWESMPGFYPYTKSGVIYFPVNPVQSITSIKYLRSSDGVQTTLNSSEYVLDKSGTRARVQPAWSKSWPDARAQFNAIEIKFKAGYGDAATNVPPLLKSAVLLMLGTLFEHRQSILQGASIHDLPKPASLSYLLSMFEVVTT